MACTVPPGYTCSPLDNSAVICPEGFYCPGGGLPARMCPGGTWSARTRPWGLPTSRAARTTPASPSPSSSPSSWSCWLICAFYTSFAWDSRPPICVAQMPKYAPVPYCPEQPVKYLCPHPGCPNHTSIGKAGAHWQEAVCDGWRALERQARTGKAGFSLERQGLAGC